MYLLPNRYYTLHEEREDASKISVHSCNSKFPAVNIKIMVLDL
jgi:hypothetical protein